ncbi:MAG: hypothetical protein ACOYIP_06440 [Coriobacteriales bacterium]|jgi:hypothetical protein
MGKAEAREMIVNLIGDEWLANILEVDLDRKDKAYIAELNTSVCLGSPIVILEGKKGIRHASVKEARRIVSEACENGLLTPWLYR